MTRAETLARIAAAIEYAERPHSDAEVQAAARALELDRRWPPLQLDLI